MMMAVLLASLKLLVLLAFGKNSWAHGSAPFGSVLQEKFAQDREVMANWPSIQTLDRPVPSAEEIMAMVEKNRQGERTKRQAEVVSEQTEVGYHTDAFKEVLPSVPSRGAARRDHNRPPTLGCFYFNTASRLPRHSRVHYAVLTFFKKCKKLKKPTTHSLLFNVKVVKEGSAGRTLLDTVSQVNCSTTGFHRIMVTDLVMDWPATPHLNRSLCLVAEDKNARNFLAAYSVQARNARPGKGREAMLSVIWENFANGAAAPICKIGKKGQSCCRAKRYINFTTLGVRPPVFFPVGYDAYTCTGTCPMRKSLSKADFLRQLKTQVQSCCHPTRRGAQPLIFYKTTEAGTNLVIETHQGMSVLTCGCD